MVSFQVVQFVLVVASYRILVQRLLLVLCYRLRCHFKLTKGRFGLFFYFIFILWNCFLHFECSKWWLWFGFNLVLWRLCYFKISKTWSFVSKWTNLIILILLPICLLIWWAHFKITKTTCFISFNRLVHFKWWKWWLSYLFLDSIYVRVLVGIMIIFSKFLVLQSFVFLQLLQFILIEIWGQLDLLQFLHFLIKQVALNWFLNELLKNDVSYILEYLDYLHWEELVSNSDKLHWWWILFESHWNLLVNHH